MALKQIYDIATDAAKVGLNKLDDLFFPRADEIPSARTIDRLAGKEKLAKTKGSRQRLSPSEYTNLKNLNLTAPERQQITAQMLRYKNKFTREGGFQPFDLKVNRKNNGDLEFEPRGKAGTTGFTYNRDVVSGKELAGTERHGAVNELATKMAQQIRGATRGGSNDAYNVMKSRHWYNNVRDKLRETYGSQGGIYSQQQAAGSPNTKLKTNFKQSDDFFKRYMGGDFDSLLKDVDKHLAGGGTIDTLPDSLLPRKAVRNAKGELPKYGMHGKSLLKVIYDDFRNIQTGTAPKMRNYDLNLIGEGPDATIDMWAARHLQGLSGRSMPPPGYVKVGGKWQGTGFDAQGTWLGGRPLKPSLEGPAGDSQWIQHKGLASKGTPSHIGGEYGFGKDVYEEAANKLRQSDPDQFADITARDLQAMGWLDTQNQWKHKGWGMPSEDASLIDLISSAEKPGHYTAGMSIDRPDVLRSPMDWDMARKEVAAGMPGSPMVNKGHGIYNSAPEPTLDMNALVYGDDAMQQSAMEQLTGNISGMVPKWSQEGGHAVQKTPLPTPTSHPGLEAFYEPGTMYTRADGTKVPLDVKMAEQAEARNIYGATTRGTPVSNTPTGIEVMDIPQYGEIGDLSKLARGQGIGEGSAAARSNLELLASDWEGLPGITHVGRRENEINVMQGLDSSIKEPLPGGGRHMKFPEPSVMMNETAEEAYRRSLWERFGVLGMPSMPY